MWTNEYDCAGASGRFKHVFMRQGFESEKVDTPQRQRVEFRFSLHVGDYIDVTVWPRGTHDCDGVYIVDIQIWEQDGMAKQKQLEDPQVAFWPGQSQCSVAIRREQGVIPAICPFTEACMTVLEILGHWQSLVIGNL